MSRLFRIFLLLFLLLSIGSANIKVSYDPNYAPYSYNVKGEPYGLFIDIWRYYAKENNETVTFIAGKNWDDAITLVKEQKVDYFLGTTPYEPWMKASYPFYQTKTSFFIRKGYQEKITHVGIVGDDYKEELRHYDPDLNITSYIDYDSLVDALLSQKVDAIYDDMAPLSYYAISHHQQHLMQRSSLLSKASDVDAITTSKQKKERFNRGFQRLSPKHLLEIEKRWIYEKSERYYESGQPITSISYVYDSDWRPFEWKDEMRKAHLGIISDILAIISQKTEIDFIPVPTENWEESVQLVKKGKADMFSAVPVTQARQKYLNFTQHSIYSYPAVLVSHIDSEFSLDTDFQRKRIGIVKGNSLGDWIKAHYPHAEFVFYETVQEGFQAIEEGEIDFFGINGVTALYYINILGFDQAKVLTKMDYMFHLKIALRKEVPKAILNRIDEALATISNRERNDIYRKWTSIKIQKEMDWRLLAGILLTALLIFVIFWLVNRHLKKLVDEKTKALRLLNESLEEKVEERTEALARINRHMQDSITYAALIQNTILPPQEELGDFFSDHFVIWEPKDIVGGDIYFFHTINDTQALLYVIDCTGHGVSGAFVTMLAKAIEAQVASQPDILHSPSKILSYFNRTLKTLLKQESADANVGMDAGVVHIHKTKQVLTFSGANIDLFYTDVTEIKKLKKDRYSIGYKQCHDDYQYSEHTLQYAEGTTFYLSTDGYIDQNGGEKGFPMGRKRFIRLLQHALSLPLHEQKNALLQALKRYQGDEERNDDITVIGFKLP